MLKLAFYGKGGIGKSTTVSNLSSVFAERGLRVLQIGCDPKADSTVSLHGGTRIQTILDLIRKRNNQFSLDEMVCVGDGGVFCVEAGGPSPGLGCAGRGIITALEKLQEKGAYETYKPDIILYDVLGDVVCGGFSMPMRRGYAEQVLILTSGETMSLYAAANIAMAVDHFKGRGYASLGGFILNQRNAPDEIIKVQNLARDFQSSIIGNLGWSRKVQEAESLHKTVVHAFPESHEANQYRNLADAILASGTKSPKQNACSVFSDCNSEIKNEMGCDLC